MRAALRQILAGLALGSCWGPFATVGWSAVEVEMTAGHRVAANQSVLLRLDDADQVGSFELLDHSAIGRIAIQRQSGSSNLVWRASAQTPAGWYRVTFQATSRFQVIAESLEENEPFRITVSRPGDSTVVPEVSFAFKDSAARPVDLAGLPEPVLDPTPVQIWRSSRPLWFDNKTQLELAVRRPLLIVGDLTLEPVPAEERVHLVLESTAPYNMFSDDEPACFAYQLSNLNDKRFRGTLRFVLQDVLDGSKQVREVPVAVEALTAASGEVKWTPDFGAYRLTAEVVSERGEALYQQHRHLTYGPAINIRDLPDSWPVAYHRHASHPEMIPPIGARWVRLWGGWSNMELEPGRYDWSVMDGHVRVAQKYGHRLLWVCHGIPAWALSPDVRDKHRAAAHYAPTDMDRLRPFLRAFYDRYMKLGVIGAVEIGNEPNAHPGWPPEKYGEVARVVYEETRRADPHIPVVGISMSGGLHLDYMEKALRAGLDKHMDIASLHLYEIANPVGDRSIEVKTRSFMRKLEEHGLGHLPVWNTESGSNTDIRQDGVIVPQEELNRLVRQHPNFDPSLPWRVGNSWRASSELLGTSWMIRASYQQFAMGVEKNFMFQWSGGPHHSWVHDWKPGGNPMPKIKVAAAAVMSKMLRDFGPSPTPEQPQIAQPGNGWLAFAHRFAGPRGRMTIVYTNPSQADAGSGDQQAALATGDTDTRSDPENTRSPWLRTRAPEPILLRVPVNAEAERIIIVDMLGRQLETVQPVDGMVEIAATEVPQYIFETAMEYPSAPR